MAATGARSVIPAIIEKHRDAHLATPAPIDELDALIAAVRQEG